MGIVVGADGSIGEFNIEVLRQIFGVFLDLLALNVGEVIEQDADLVLGAGAASGQSGRHGCDDRDDKEKGNEPFHGVFHDDPPNIFCFIWALP